MSHKKLPLVFTDQSLHEVETLSRNMNLSVTKVIEHALSLLKLVQGKRVILKDEKDSFEVHNYKNLPSQTQIKV